MRGNGRTAQSWKLVGLVVLFIDGMLLAAHVQDYWEDQRVEGRLNSVPSWFSEMWDGDQDGSLMELFGHVQLGVAAALLIVLGVRASGQTVFAAWGGILLLVIADDFLMIHERVGLLLELERAEPTLTTPAAQELGGLGMWAFAGIGAGILLAVAHANSSPTARRGSWVFLGMSVPLALVAVMYVLISVYWPGQLEGTEGLVIVMIRMTVKLVTMTLFLVQALRLAANRH